LIPVWIKITGDGKSVVGSGDGSSERVVVNNKRLTPVWWIQCQNRQLYFSNSVSAVRMM